MGLLDNLKDTFSQGAERVKFETDKLQRLNRLRGESSDLQQQINTSFGQLGQRAYEIFKEGGLQSPEISSLVNLIDDLQRRLQTSEHDLESAQNEKFTPTPEQPVTPPASYQNQSIAIDPPAHAQDINPPQPVDAGVYACKNCGNQLSPGAAFCPDCGTPVNN